MEEEIRLLQNKKNRLENNISKRGKIIQKY